MTRDEAITALVEKWRESARKLRTPFPGLPKNEPTAVLLDSCAQELADTLSALGGRPETGWQPIATAPKDGTPVIAYQPEGRFSNDVPFPAGVGIAHWCKEDRHNDAHWAGPLTPRGHPTCWQPLPSPPLQEQP
jgi:hypothetical protein